ncbi:hypothetical protein KKA00_10295 [bacterium]|nr:hypothetical protein [bacterium]MBU1652600.1 hypothetical protein [bacterium]
MTEQIIHGILLALHNIALVGCAAAPFYNRNLVNTRAQFGPKLHYKLDKVVEDTLQGNAPYCMAFIGILFFTGITMPLNHYLFNGAFKQLHLIAISALALKLLCVFAMVVIMWIIFFKINPKLRELMATFKPEEAPATDRESLFFTLRAQRKALCEKCLWFAVGVLVFSAFLGFGT